jgi:aspartate-semialdehyde dehydrogenase
VYKIAIAGASTLLGRELKEALSESPLAASNFVLLDEEEAQGQLDQVGDEVTLSRPSLPTPSTTSTSPFSAARKT